MRLAIKEARKNLKSISGGPFGACIARGNKVLAVARNTVLRHDASCHAEINAIRIASRKIKNFDLSRCFIYSTTEPCPMCFSAIHWSRIKTIIYGTKIQDVKKLGFNELSISNARMKSLGVSKVKVIGGFLSDECRKLLKDWDRLDAKVAY